MKISIENLENKLQKAHVMRSGNDRSAIKQYSEQIKANRPNFGVGNFNHTNLVSQGRTVPENISKYSAEILQLNRWYQRQDQINARIQELEGSIHPDETEEFRTK